MKMNMGTEINKYKGRMGMQHKVFSINSKEAQYDSESRTISGYAAVFGNRDKVGDVLLKGCFPRAYRNVVHKAVPTIRYCSYGCTT